MADDPDMILMTAEEAMDKALDYLKAELKGVRTGRATPGLIEFVKVEAYGAATDLRSVALVTAPEPTQLLVKPFDPSTVKDIAKGIEAAGLGLNPTIDGKVVRINIPPSPATAESSSSPRSNRWASRPRSPSATRAATPTNTSTPPPKTSP